MDWFDVLEICRSLETPFKPVDLQQLAQFETTFKKNGDVRVSGLQRASSWCAQLVKMKILEQAGVDNEKTGPGRKGYFYKISEAGLKMKAKPLSKLDRLLRAVNQLKAARGRPEEGKLYADLFRIASEVEKELPLSRRASLED